MAQSSVLRQSKIRKGCAKARKKCSRESAERVGLNTEKVAVQVNKLQQKVESHSSEAAKLNKTVNELSKRMGISKIVYLM